MSRNHLPLVGQQIEVSLKSEVVDAPNAFPVVVPTMLKDGPSEGKILSFGGLSKLEFGALMCAALQFRGGVAVSEAADLGVQLARDVLERCKPKQ